MAGQCVVFNSNISISCSCLCHPLYSKIQHARLFKVWNNCFLKQCILRSQEELWYFSWEYSFGSIGNECYSCVSTKTNICQTALNACHGKGSASLYHRTRIRCRQPSLSSLQLLPGPMGSCWAPSASLQHCHTASCCWLWPAPAPETLAQPHCSQSLMEWLSTWWVS